LKLPIVLFSSFTVGTSGSPFTGNVPVNKHFHVVDCPTMPNVTCSFAVQTRVSFHAFYYWMFIFSKVKQFLMISPILEWSLLFVFITWMSSYLPYQNPLKVKLFSPNCWVGVQLHSLISESGLLLIYIVLMVNIQMSF
jgi:hypothetical protein